MHKAKNKYQTQFFITAILFISALLGGFAVQIKAQAIRPTVISGNADRTGTGNNASQRTSISADGRFIVFASLATNLVSGLTDTNDTYDVFLFDTRTNQMRCLSRAISGNTTGDFLSGEPVITPNGNYVVFGSTATNLVAGDTNGKSDVFRYNVASGEIVMVSRTPDNLSGGNDNSFVNFAEYKPYDISDDGRYIAFVSLASNLLPEPFLDNNNKSDVFVRDLVNNTTKCVTFSTTLASTADGNSYDVNINSDGRRVKFTSETTNLIDGLMDTNASRDIFIRDIQAVQSRCASCNVFQGQNFAFTGDGGVMSRDGSRVVYYSNSTNLVTNDSPDSFIDAFVYDYGLNTVFLVSVTPDGNSSGNENSSSETSVERYTISISPNGRFVVFDSKANNLVAGLSDTNNDFDVFRRDLALGETKLVSVNRLQNAAGNIRSSAGKKGASVSSDGRFISFRSQASNLIAENYTTGFPQPFVRDMNQNITYAVTLNLSGNGIGTNESFRPEIAGNGSSVIFESALPSLTPNDGNFAVDIFRTRIPNAQPAVSDFDGDGKTDVAVFRPSNGTWYSLPADGFVNIRNWGISSDKIVPADYDGDGKTDHAVFRASENNWYLQKSVGIVAETVSFGISGDIPAPADFDGDGRADIAVFRPSNGTWYIRQSSNGQVRFQNFGQSGDQPIASDYDGDGKADVAVFRPNANTWFILRSSDNSFVSAQFGANGDKLVPADYDGDSKTDIAVFRPSNGAWYILESRTSQFRATSFGLASDKPVSGDYDGDGRADIAVFRPSDGNWYIWQSSNSTLLGLNWGLAADIPIPTAYTP